MDSTLQTISVGEFIHEHNRSLEKKRDISKWFLDETMVVDFGDSVGRPSSLITLQKEYLTRFLENGWTIDAVMKTSEGGRWTTLRKTKSTSDTSGDDNSSNYSSSRSSSEGQTNDTTNVNSNSNSNTSSQSSTDGNTSSEENSNSNTESSQQSSSNQHSNSVSTSSSSSSESSSGSSSSGNTSSRSSQSSTSTQNSNTSNNSNSSSSGSTSGSSSSSSTNASSTSNNSNTSGNESNNTQSSTNRSDNTSTSTGSSGSKRTSSHEENDGTEDYDGDAYWAAVQRVRLKRRRMQPELVLQDMIDSYVVQFNDGIRNEDSRFNELVTLYGVMLNRNETEGNAIINGALDVTGLFDKLSASIDITWTSANNTAIDLWKQGAKGNIAEIKYKYEALISSTRAKMVGQGTYNGTVWPTVEAGITRQMEAAIAEARTTGMATANKAITDVLNAKGDVMAQLVNAKNAIASQIDQRKITVIELRNTVLQSMINFIGSRQDAFPQIQEISQLASQIGFTVGAAGNVL